MLMVPVGLIQTDWVFLLSNSTLSRSLMVIQNSDFSTSHHGTFWLLVTWFKKWFGLCYCLLNYLQKWYPAQWLLNRFRSLEYQLNLLFLSSLPVRPIVQHCRVLSQVFVFWITQESKVDFKAKAFRVSGNSRWWKEWKAGRQMSSNIFILLSKAEDTTSASWQEAAGFMWSMVIILTNTNSAATLPCRIY